MPTVKESSKEKYKPDNNNYNSTLPKRRKQVRL